MNQRQLIHTLHRARKLKKLSQLQLAKTAGLQQDQISKYERLMEVPRTDNLFAWINALGFEILIQHKDEK